MSRSVEWKVEQPTGAGYFLMSRESGSVSWEGVRKRGLFGNLDKAQFQRTLDAYQEKLAAMGVTVTEVIWP